VRRFCVGDEEGRGCRFVHLRQTCEFEAEGKACFYKNREKMWRNGKRYREEEYREKKVHAEDVSQEEWKARVILAGLRGAHGRREYMG